MAHGLWGRPREGEAENPREIWKNSWKYLCPGTKVLVEGLTLNRGREQFV